MHWIKLKLKDYFFRLTNRQLWIFLLLFTLVFIGAYFRFDWPLWSLLTGLSVCIIAGLFAVLGRVLYTVLMVLTSPIGWCVSMFSLLCVFYLIVTPMRLFKKKQVVGWVKSTESIDPAQQYE